MGSLVNTHDSNDAERMDTACIYPAEREHFADIEGHTKSRSIRRMAKELAKKASGLVSAISTASAGGLSTRPSRIAYDEIPDEPRDHTLSAHEVLAERASRAGKLGGGISSGGLSTRPSRKAYEVVKPPFDELRKPSASPLRTMAEDTEVSQTQVYGPVLIVDST